MSKKVLISLSQLRHLCSPDNCRPPNSDHLEAIMGSRARQWFDAQPPAPQWVRVEDGLPEHYQDVLIKTKGCDDIISAVWHRIDNHFFSNISGYDYPEATHWMPAPPLPEEEN